MNAETSGNSNAPMILLAFGGGSFVAGRFGYSIFWSVLEKLSPNSPRGGKPGNGMGECY